MCKDRVLFKTPAGASEHPWNNTSMGISGAVTCELCGTDWPEITSSTESSYSVGSFLGRQFVEECCGSAVDTLYREFGDVFARQFLHDFAESPLDPRFAVFRIVLRTSLEKAQKRSEAMAAEARGLQQLTGVS